MMPIQIPRFRGEPVYALLTDVITPRPPPVSRFTPRSARSLPTARASSSCSSLPEPITPTVCVESIIFIALTFLGDGRADFEAALLHQLLKPRVGHALGRVVEPLAD